MKIGYDAKRLFFNASGLGQYSGTLLNDLGRYFPNRQYVLFSPSTQDIKSSIYREKPYKTVFIRGFLNTQRVLGFSKKMKAEGIDIFHGLSNELPLNIHRLSIPSVVSIHDVIFKVIPQNYSPIDRWIYDFKTRYACRHARHIVAISEHTKRDLIKYYHLSPDKISVIYQTCHERFKQSPADDVIPDVAGSLPDAYFLVVGSIIPRKNLHNILAALSLIPTSKRPQIVVVGRGKPRYLKVLKDMIQKNDLESYVHFYHDITDRELPYLYRRALCSLYISNYEGFGIPIIESLFCGTPVIASNTSSMPEALGPGGVTVNPSDVAGISELLLHPPEWKDSEVNVFLKNFDSHTIANQWMHLYQRLLD